MSVQFTWQPTPIQITSISPINGSPAGGFTVTIQGVNFLSGATVTFGGTAATGVTVVSSSMITCTAPAHVATSVTVVVTNTDSTFASIGFSYLNTPSGFVLDYVTTGGSPGNPRLDNNPITINQSLGQPSSCSFTGDLEPLGSGAMAIQALGQTLFSGTIARKKRREDENHVVSWDITAMDLTWQLRRSFPNGMAFVDQTASTVFSLLLASFAPAFTVIVDSTLLTLISYTLTGTKSLDTVLTDLCGLCSATWFIDDTTLHVFNSTSGDVVSETVTDSSVDIGSPSVEWDYSQIRNSVKVYYAAPSGATTQPFVQVQDGGSIALYGEREYGISKTDLPDQQSATAYALNLLEQYRNPIPTVSYACRDVSTRAGRTVSVSLSMISGTFIVRTVKIDQINEGFNNGAVYAPRFTVTATPPNVPMTYISPSAPIPTIVSAVKQALDTTQQQGNPPKLTGDVTTTGGAASIPEGSVTNCQLAGCIDGNSKLNDASVGSSKLTATGVTAGTYGG